MTEAQKKVVSFVPEKTWSELSDEEAVALCGRLREELLDSVSQTGGHLASNLGVVELTVALHRVFDLSRDRLVFDVGHQCYPHKMLTGRAGAMDTLRTFGGLSGFPKPSESRQDAFIAGHASNAVSVALGMARARTLQHEDYSVIALLGDGALTGGLAYEGLSNAGQSNEPLIVILNDNGMSITKNVGGVAQHLAHQRLKPQYLRLKRIYRSLTGHGPIGQHIYRFTHKIKKAVKDTILPCSMFEDMGFAYMGPVDGHDVNYLTKLLHYAKNMNCPVVLHVKTVKGKGYAPAETHPNTFHGIAPFDRATGALKKPAGRNFSAAFGETLCALAQRDERICAITAAMQSGTGLDSFAEQYPDHFFDVGIAEGHAVSMAAGMAKQGLLPVFAVYSSFLQRSYDMLIHDVAIQNLHVVLAVDRAGLVGDDGETHHGVFDVAFLSSVPGMTILAPASFSELKDMLEYAVFQVRGPVAVRYPRGGEGNYRGYSGKCDSAVLKHGTDLTLVTYGTMINEVLSAAELLQQERISAEVIKLNSIQPIDYAAITQSLQKTRRLLVAEECVSMGCIGQQISAYLAEHGAAPEQTALCNLGTGFITHGTVAQLRQLQGLDARSLFQRAKEVCSHG